MQTPNPKTTFINSHPISISTNRQLPATEQSDSVHNNFITRAVLRLAYQLI
jgi:hypothetical protein